MLLCIPTALFANNVNGGELSFQEVSDSTYRFTLTLQWNCETGVSEPTSVPLCFYNPCTSAYLSATMTKNAGNPEKPVPCAAYPTICTWTSSALPGTRVLTYSAVVTLPSRCANWRISSYYSHRNIARNLTNYVFYTEATINNLVYNNNSSAQSANQSVLIIRQNTPYTYAFDISDTNGDSVVVESAMPMYVSVPTTCSYTPVSTALATKTPSLNISTNPFQTNNSFSINNTTKAITFTPTEIGEQVLDINIKEFRTGTQISSHMKEIRFAVMGANRYSYNVNRNYANVTNCIRTGDTITVCAGASFGFITDIKSNLPSSSLYITDNHLYNANSAVVSYSTQKKDSVRASFQWTAPSTPGTTHLVVFTVTDSSCVSTDVTSQTTMTFPVYINVVGKPLALKDTTICAGSNYKLLATRGGNYTWAILPGGTAGSLSCTACANPTATPAVTTSYEVTSAASAMCGNNKDTVTITVEPNKTTGITLAPAAVYYTPGTPVTFTATGTGCNTPTYVWKKNGTVIAGATGTTYTYTPTALDNISCEMKCADLCASPKLVSATRSLQWNVGIANTTATMHATIYPNPGNGSFEIAGYAAANSNIQYTITNTAGQSILNGSYTVKAGSYRQTLKTNLPAGVYILKLKDGNNNTAIQKLIVQ